MAKTLRKMSDKKKADAGKQPVSAEPEEKLKTPDEINKSKPGEANFTALMERYGGKSEDELMNELLEVTAEQKREGKFDSSQIDSAAERILPLLNPEQAKRLQSILEKIK